MNKGFNVQSKSPVCCFPTVKIPCTYIEEVELPKVSVCIWNAGHAILKHKLGQHFAADVRFSVKQQSWCNGGHSSHGHFTIKAFHDYNHRKSVYTNTASNLANSDTFTLRPHHDASTTFSFRTQLITRFKKNKKHMGQPP